MRGRKKDMRTKEGEVRDVTTRTGGEMETDDATQA